MIFNLGAPSNIDLWDMKPDAPAEIRGPFKPVDDQRPRHPALRDLLPLHAEDRRQVLAGPVASTTPPRRSTTPASR